MNLLSPALTCPPSYLVEGLISVLMSTAGDLQLQLTQRTVWPGSDLCEVLSVWFPGSRKLLSNHMLLSSQPCEWHLNKAKAPPTILENLLLGPSIFFLVVSQRNLTACEAFKHNYKGFFCKPQICWNFVYSYFTYILYNTDQLIIRCDILTIRISVFLLIKTKLI